MNELIAAYDIINLQEEHDQVESQSEEERLYQERMECFRSLSSDEREYELDQINFADMCRAGWNQQNGCATYEDLEINEKCKIVEHDNRQKSYESSISQNVYSQNQQLTQEVVRLTANVNEVTEKLIRQQHLNDLMFENIQLIFNKQFGTKQETCAFIQSKKYEENEDELTQFLAEYTRISRWFEKDEFVWEESVEASVDGSLAESVEDSAEELDEELDEESDDNEDPIIIIDEVDL